MTQKKQKKKQGFKTFWSRIRFKYKLTFINEDTLEEVWTFRLSQLSAFAVLLVFVFLLVSVTALIIIKTPIRNYLPGYLDVEVRKEIVQNALRADSLERMLNIQHLYLENIARIIGGDVPLDSIRRIDSLARVDANFDIPRKEAEASFVKQFEEEEKYSLTVLKSNPVFTEQVFFYKPVDGIVSSHYQDDIRHFGVDIAASSSQSVVATLDGTVIYAGFDSDYGNVIHLQHKNGLISIYKHNEALLKEIGDHVVAGEAIALVGNTGTLSTGTHLHFELWYKGIPLNPEEYIAF